MISVNEAISILLDHTASAEEMEIPLKKADGMVLAQNFTTPFPQPRFTNSSMDGFAVITNDIARVTTAHPVKLNVAGASYAGNPFNQTLQTGDCCKIMTGAVLPRGADAVVMVENTSGFSDNGSCTFFKSVCKGENIRFAGEEIQEGQTIINGGTVIDASISGVLASYGIKKLTVKKPPEISLLCLGDEFNQTDEDIENGEIYDSNSIVIKNLIGHCGGKLNQFSLIPDENEIIQKSIVHSLKQSDILITTGGISMGEKDLLRSVFNKLGITELFWKVAQKPGKPLYAGTINNKLIVSLPGNPVSAYICFMVYIYPVIQKLLNVKPIPQLNAVLKTVFPTNSKKYRFLFGKVWSKEGQLFCQPSAKTGSHMLTSSLESNCIVCMPPSSVNGHPGQMVDIIQFPWKCIDDKSQD